MDFKTQVAAASRAGRHAPPTRCWSSSSATAVPAALWTSRLAGAAGRRRQARRLRVQGRPLRSTCTARRREGDAPGASSLRPTARPRPSRPRSAAGLGQLKALGSEHVGRRQRRRRGADRGARARRWSLAVGDAVYVYRHTKPSAPAASQAGAVTLLARQGAGRGRRRRACGAARPCAAGVTLARECANRPGNHCTPTYLADRGQEARQGLRPQGRGARPQADREARHGLLPGGRPGLGRAAALHRRCSYHGAAKTQAPVVLVGKGITFDTGGISLKPAPRWTR